MGNDLRERVLEEIRKVVVGRDDEADLLLISLIAEGHVLLEGVPGVSKTILAKSFARCLGLEFRRLQFTPDMLPMDTLGGFVFNVKTREFELRKGPVFTNILLADEINRAPPKVQSALLEAMQERQVTVEGHTEPLPNPFMVIATQNPVEFRGVYPLPEGQLDRFLMKVELSYPVSSVESKIIKRNLTTLDIGLVQVVLGAKELGRIIEEVHAVAVSDEIIDYLSAIALETRQDKRLSLGASPRAMVHLVSCARANAYLQGRDFVTPDDVKKLSVNVLAHRMKLDESAILAGTAPDQSAVVREVINRVRPPR